MSTGYTAMPCRDHCDNCTVLRDPCHRCGEPTIPPPSHGLTRLHTPTDDTLDVYAAELGMDLSAVALQADAPFLSDGGYALKKDLYPLAFARGMIPWPGRHG